MLLSPYAPTVEVVKYVVKKSALKIDVVNCVGTFHIKRPPRVRYCNSSSAVCQEVSQINFCTAVSKDKTAEIFKISVAIFVIK